MGNYLDEFRNPETAKKLAGALKSCDGEKISIMEVCGTHTMAIFRYGIRELLPDSIRLISGPGCPVCVTPVSFIDAAVEIAAREGVITASFGDLLKVPGSASSLAIAKSEGADVRIIYSPLDILKIAEENPDKKVVFISVGFETTAPITALTVLKAHENGTRNFSVLSANKTMPQALKLLAKRGDSSSKERGKKGDSSSKSQESREYCDKRDNSEKLGDSSAKEPEKKENEKKEGDSSPNLDGFLYPGHVSAITGTALYEELAAGFGMPGVIAGFEPLDLMHAIISLAGIIRNHENKVINEYSRVVRKDGNPVALEKLFEVFEHCTAVWRGLGRVEGSGLRIRDKYERFDAWKVFGVMPQEGKEPSGCLCGEVLTGRATPGNCGLFGTACTPESPVGACMVSSEGTCAAYYRFGRRLS